LCCRRHRRLNGWYPDLELSFWQAFGKPQLVVALSRVISSDGGQQSFGCFASSMATPLTISKSASVRLAVDNKSRNRQYAGPRAEFGEFHVVDIRWNRETAIPNLAADLILESLSSQILSQNLIASTTQSSLPRASPLRVLQAPIAEVFQSYPFDITI
jgi:hypothetical protein